MGEGKLEDVRRVLDAGANIDATQKEGAGESKDGSDHPIDSTPGPSSDPGPGIGFAIDPDFDLSLVGESASMMGVE